MKVLIAPEYSPFGGTHSFFLKILDIHKEAGIESGVIIEKKRQDQEISDLCLKNGVRLFTTYNRRWPFSKAIFACLSDIGSLFRGYRTFHPDILVISNGTPGIMLGTLFFPVPVVFIMHTYPQGRFRWPLRLFWNIAAKLRGNYFITVSRFSANLINQNMGIPSTKIKVIYNSFGKVVPSHPKTKPMVLTLGHVVCYKNPEIWLQVSKRVLEKNPDTVFIWLGVGELLDVMRQRVKSDGYKNSIFFKGYCADTWKYYAEAWVYFQPSLIESHGISIVEAMAHGLPCVCSNVGGIPESVVDKETGYLCEPEAIDDFAIKLSNLIETPVLRRKMGDAGRLTALNKFSDIIQKQKIIKLYKELDFGHF